MIIAVSTLILMSSCEKGNICGCESEPKLKDTEFSIAYKLVDGSWDTTKRVLPSTASFWVGSTDKGTYAMYYREAEGSEANILKAAVIDYVITNKKLVLDTTAQKVDLLPSTREN